MSHRVASTVPAMARTCPRCSRLNPGEARFCFRDGAALGPGVGERPANNAFPRPFVFPSGRSCNGFDELALAVLDEWDSARQLVQHGDLANFLAATGRTDLAQLCRQAGRQKDLDQGLDQILAALPTRAIEPAQLHLEPTQVNLGTLVPGQETSFKVHLTNRGMRLLTGSVTAFCPWLAVGEGAGSASKVFQFGSESTIAVRVRGKALRASAKTLEGKLVFESNGGAGTVLVRAEVPVRAFEYGALGGSTSPRQLAEKARSFPKEAAALFESGAVAQWYAANGWDYPVLGPQAAGIGGVQQFFEALGLTTPPRVDLSENTVFFTGDPGSALERTLRINAREKRPVYAHARSDRPWLEVSRVKSQGQSGSLRISVACVPDRPGELLRANVHIVANGNQSFVVPVTLAVGGPLRGSLTEPTVSTSVKISEARETPKAAASVPSIDLRHQPEDSGWIHLLAPAILFVGLMIALLHDLLGSRVSPIADVVEEAGDRITVTFHDREENIQLGEGGIKPESGTRSGPTREAVWEPSMRFGLSMLGAHDANGRPKRLTFEANGVSNNTCVLVDGNERLFGETQFRVKEGRSLPPYPGHWLQRDQPLGSSAEGRSSRWEYEEEHLEIVQRVEIVKGTQSNALDTCLVQYRLINHDRIAHDVGLRFLLDTFIGGNDGVPFLIPGESKLCDTQLDLNGSAVPPYIQACENDDLTKPGTVARLQLRVDSAIEAPDRVTLGAWPNVQLPDRRCRQEKTLWEVPVLPIRSMPGAPDSAVTMYWSERSLPSGGQRLVGFAYGLGRLAATEGGGRLAVTVGGAFIPGGEISVTAYVKEPTPGQAVTLQVPDRFQLLEGTATLTVPPLAADAPGRASPVTWKLRAPVEVGDYALKVQSSSGAAQSIKVAIKRQGIFGG